MPPTSELEDMVILHVVRPLLDSVQSTLQQVQVQCSLLVQSQAEMRSRFEEGQAETKARLDSVETRINRVERRLYWLLGAAGTLAGAAGTLSAILTRLH